MDAGDPTTDSPACGEDLLESATEPHSLPLPLDGPAADRLAGRPGASRFGWTAKSTHVSYLELRVRGNVERTNYVSWDENERCTGKLQYES